MVRSHDAVGQATGNGKRSIRTKRKHTCTPTNAEGGPASHTGVRCWLGVGRLMSPLHYCTTPKPQWLRPPFAALDNIEGKRKGPRNKEREKGTHVRTCVQVELRTFSSWERSFRRIGGKKETKCRTSGLLSFTRWWIALRMSGSSMTQSEEGLSMERRRKTRRETAQVRPRRPPNTIFALGCFGVLKTCGQPPTTCTSLDSLRRGRMSSVLMPPVCYVM